MVRKDVEDVVREISRRDEILSAAIETFAKHGYHGSSTGQIAKIVGIHKTTLYHYFPSKEELLFAVLNQFTEGLIDGLSRISSSGNRPLEKLRQAFHYHLDAEAKHIDEFSLLLHETKYLKARRRKQITSKRERYEGLIGKIIQDGVDSGELRVEGDIGYAAFSFLGVVNWMYYWYRSGKLPPEQVAERSWDLICTSIAVPSEVSAGRPDTGSTG